MMQIMVLESMVSAYTFAAATVEGGRPTDYQQLLSGMLVICASLAFSYAKPGRRLSKTRPIDSIFHPAIVTSVIGQVLVHLGCLIIALRMAKAEMGDDVLTSLYKFEKKRDDQVID
jgi:manganese-transporting P-type ATPase